MTTFNISRSNDQANSNILLIGIALVAIIAVIVAFAPAFFSTSAVAVEGAPFGNGSNDGNFVTLSGATFDGLPPGAFAGLPSENVATVDDGSTTFSIDCTAGSITPFPDGVGSNGVVVTANDDVVVLAEDKAAPRNFWVFSFETCSWSDKQLG